jgi:hypothetical protein
VKLLVAILFSAGGVGCLMMGLLLWQMRRTIRTELELVRNRRHKDETQLLAAAALLQAWVESHPEQADISSETRGLLGNIKGDLADAEEELC